MAKPTNKQTDGAAATVAYDERLVAELEQKRAACVQRGTELQDERANVELRARIGDTKVRQRLDAINKEGAEHAFEPWQRLNP